jgi:hypothetical protein
MGDGIKNFYESMSTVPVEPTVFDLKAFQKALDAMPGAIDIPLFYSSKLIDPDTCYKMNADFGFSMLNFDKKAKVMYVCGTNVRDSLIKKGVAFQNYKPE